jgi:coenzyme F420-dependent glucose-6-phosphate dehydrogenase
MTTSPPTKKRTHEQFTVSELLELRIAAEQAGFDLLAVSDHFQPCRQTKGIPARPGSLGQRTKRIRMGTRLLAELAGTFRALIGL